MVHAVNLPQLSFQTEPTAYFNARLGRIQTAHGVIETPAFIFCATKAVMKGLDIHTVKSLGTQIILSNTYHLMLRPGGKYVEERGGLQKFTGWHGPMLTDSGGFQVFSLGSGDYISELKNRYHAGKFGTHGGITKVTEEGVICKSYYDGTVFNLTPEYSIETQCQLGADLIVVSRKPAMLAAPKPRNHNHFLPGKHFLMYTNK